MSFTINEKIHTTLDYKEISTIAVGVGELIKVHEAAPKPDKEFIERAKKLVNRLGIEMYSYPETDFTKKE